eukprot:401224-Pyramimonas_sp.AAC.1
MTCFASALLCEQCGGVGGRSVDMVALAVRTFLRHCIHSRSSGIVICLDIAQAFYTTIKQLALQLPGDEARLSEALDQLSPPPLLAQGVKAQLRRQPLLDNHFPRDELLALIQDTQRGTHWKVREAEGFVAPPLGSRPGTAAATDIFNSVFRQVHLDMRQGIQTMGRSWQEAHDAPPLKFATERDWDTACTDLSFVDDLT